MNGTNLVATRPNLELYQQILVECLDKIRKTIPKKFKELKDLCGDAIDLVKAEQPDTHLNANKYFRIFKLALDTKIPKLTEQILQTIQKLVAHGFMDGNFPDDCLYPEDERPKSNGILPRKLIDAIVDEVCKCTEEGDQQVQLQVVRALLTIVATNSTQVHEKSLLKVMSSLYYIHIASKNPVNQNTAKGCLMQLVSIVFKKMEQYASDFAEPLRKAGSDLSESIVNQQMNSHRIHSKALQERPLESGRILRPETDTSVLTGDEQLQPTTNSDKQSLVTFTPEEQYAFVTLNFIVDQVCIYDGLIQATKDKFQDQIANSNGERSEIGRITQAMDDEISKIQYYSVPRSKAGKKSDESDKGAGKKVQESIQSLNLFNEVGNACGKFGWCVACRGSANLYCKHTKQPVCSFECKQRYIQLLEEASAMEEGNQTDRSISVSQVQEEPYTRDARLIFNKLCQLLQSKELQGKIDSVYGVRKVLLGLDLIHSCLENPGPTFLNRREFVGVVRYQLCNSLLQFAVSNEHQIFSKTVAIFYCLFLHFREHLKQTIAVLLDNFFLRILVSGNSEYDYKYCILEFFDKLSENADHILEIFANYDCDIGQKDVCFRIIESLSNIALGKFQRSEHQSVITQQQESSLRRLALVILVKILRNLDCAIETEKSLEAMTNAKLAQLKQQRQESILMKERQSSDLKEEEEDSQTVLTEQESEKIKSVSEERTGDENMDAKQQIQNRIYKQEMEKAANKFNLKPKNGLKYLTDKGYLPKEPREEMIKGICKFFKETPALSATAIGQYLGEDKDPNRDVLSQYVDEFDFTAKTIGFIDALKILLNGFRLPGEGQQVDRIMEKFGEKLSKDRPVEFGNAEGVYILAYATLMLQTSVHNPQAQKLKMTLADFKKITSGVKLNDSGAIDLKTFLTDIYDTVVREPFTLEEDEEARMKKEATTNTNKKQLFEREREALLRRGATMLKQDTKNNKFVLLKDISTIKPLFEQTWSANLAVFSRVLEEADDVAVADLCLQGLMHGIRISGHYEIGDVRDPFVRSLSGFTMVSATKELKQKNVNCIRELINLAIYDGECLRDSWYSVLQCISKIDQMRVIGMGELTDSEFFQSESGNQIHSQASHQMLLKNSAIIAENVDANQIDSIFLQSEKLSPEAIKDFIESLCRVSKEELGDEDAPKKFCLQKIVEVASLNMNRVRFHWQHMWNTMGDHFTWVGSHKNLHVVIYALDSLRQLADKFLEIEERKNFSYQKMFLKPFQIIMMNNILSQQHEIKEYIVMCIAALCNHKARFIMSGWEVILDIFKIAAQDTETHLVVQSFQSLEHAVKTHFDILKDNFTELVNCIAKFSLNMEHSSRAQNLLMICAAKLRDDPEITKNYFDSKGQKLFKDDQVNMERLPPSYGITFEQAKKQGKKGSHSLIESNPDEESVRLSVAKELWFPILRAFTGLIMERSDMIREEALIRFKQILADCHLCFTERMWREILSQVILPVLEDYRIQVEMAAKRQNADLAKAQAQTSIVVSILETLNQFFRDKVGVLPRNLIVSYTDILCLYSSGINYQPLAEAVMNQLLALFQFAAKLLDQKDTSKSAKSQDNWQDVVNQLTLLLLHSEPKLIVDELRQASQRDEAPHQLINQEKQWKQQPSRSVQSRQTVDNTKFKFDHAYAQSTTQLITLRCIEEIVNNKPENLCQKLLHVVLGAVEGVQKLSKEFNSELNLRFKLWKQGFHQDLPHLPGLLELEEQSLKVLMKILFLEYFRAKEGKFQQFERIRDQVFGLSSKVLKDYVVKHSELVAINASKQSQGGKEESKEQQLSTLHETELENQISHLGPVLHEVVLENLHLLSDQDLKEQLGEMGQLLIDLTLYDDPLVRQKNHKLLSRIFQMLQ